MTGCTAAAYNSLTEETNNAEIIAQNIESLKNAEDYTLIELDGNAAKISGFGAENLNGTITINKSGKYILTGKYTGQIRVEAPKDCEVLLVLNGAELTGKKNAAIYAVSADKLVIDLAGGTTNTVTDISSYTYEDAGAKEPNAAIFCKCDLTIGGEGTLSVFGNFKNGVNTKDDLVITGGNILINAVDDGLRGKDSVTINGGKFDIISGKDGIQTKSDLLITGGEFRIFTGGGSVNAPVREEDFRGGGRGGFGFMQQQTEAKDEEDSESMKALKAEKSIFISGGVFTLDSEDDAIHSNGDIKITAGSFEIKTGDDAFHADNALEISGGIINIFACYEGLEGISVTIKGGDISITARDDAINAAGGADSSSDMRGPMGMDKFNAGAVSDDIFIRITGGNLDLYAPNDGFDSNGNIFIEGGSIAISASSMGMDGAIDMDGTLIINGGELIAAGSVLFPSQNSTQPTLLVSYTKQQPSGSFIEIKDFDENIILEYESKTAFDMSGFTSPRFETGGMYSLYINGEKQTDFKIESMITTISNDGGAYNEYKISPQGGGGMPQGKRRR